MIITELLAFAGSFIIFSMFNSVSNLVSKTNYLIIYLSSSVNKSLANCLLNLATCLSASIKYSYLLLYDGISNTDIVIPILFEYLNPKF